MNEATYTVTVTEKKNGKTKKKTWNMNDLQEKVKQPFQIKDAIVTWKWYYAVFTPGKLRDKIKADIVSIANNAIKGSVVAAFGMIKGQFTEKPKQKTCKEISKIK